MTAAHSKFSASAAPRWLACPGSVVLSAGKPDSGSKYAAWGTVAHELADAALSAGWTKIPADGLQISTVVGEHMVDIDRDMVACVETYIANVREMTAGADLFRSERRVNYSRWIGVPEDAGWGTADVIAVLGAELQVHDLKTGQGVEVDARDNEQMMLYAGGALAEIDDLGLDIETVRLVIHQPRIRQAPSEWSLSVDELRTWLTGRARSGAASVLNAEACVNDPAFATTFLSPGEKQCKFCKAKATCPALAAAVLETVQGAPATVDDFDDLTVEKPAGSTTADFLANALTKVDMIEEWCTAVRAEAERRLLAGEKVPGFKLVQGKRGARKWANEKDAEAALKTFRLKLEEMYDFKLISPTSAEKLAKAETIGPRQWTKLQQLITQTEGKPHVAPASDPRTAIDVRPVVDAFENVADDIC